MIAKPIWFFANRHNLLALGDLRKIRSGEASANFRPNGVLQFPRLIGNLEIELLPKQSANIVKRHENKEG